MGLVKREVNLYTLEKLGKICGGGESTLAISMPLQKCGWGLPSVTLSGNTSVTYLPNVTPCNYRAKVAKCLIYKAFSKVAR